MAVPKKKTSKSRRNMRRSHDKLPFLSFDFCPECKFAKRPHHICGKCGWYGKSIVKENLVSNKE
jgi:large subunit ribosomal protein L32